eukprot:CAMPEP_0181451554 /NCGR_PEP_ID=MMETSP1110-20121109/28752_1 /TAXON_ID=174948 /ORGANISM="Symbiodinium sp., Strain CCMP421" /LENGTH=245 /DNA_ID=CAMNT_0023575811 /DNA_START=49 /DNA_END=784 /DNA_ORIENTATION=+
MAQISEHDQGNRPRLHMRFTFIHAAQENDEQDLPRTKSEPSPATETTLQSAKQGITEQDPFGSSGAEATTLMLAVWEASVIPSFVDGLVSHFKPPASVSMALTAPTVIIPVMNRSSVGARQLRNLRTICKQDVRENLQHLVLLVLAERLQAMQMTAVAGPTIEALFSLLTPRSAGRSRAERNLYKYLRRMGFAQLMSVLAHNGCEHVADSLESAFHQIRDSADGSRKTSGSGISLECDANCAEIE